MGLGLTQTWDPSSQITSFIALGKQFNFSDAWFPYLEKERIVCFLAVVGLH